MRRYLVVFALLFNIIIKYLKKFQKGVDKVHLKVYNKDS